VPSERVQRQIDSLLDEAEAAIRSDDWSTVRQRAQQALTLDPDNADAGALLVAAERGIGTRVLQEDDSSTPARPTPPLPTSFAKGRYVVK